MHLARWLPHEAIALRASVHDAVEFVDAIVGGGEGVGRCRL
jgi:hypothetical protein